ncbi:MAG: hypothetical protein Ct9H90mP16_08480 [Candidatus Poseidoniales archaeon]|nr:MAG: hypothetical protein Ct9H90mP16_08480 [Candidatus Poseidoniales archaeon]
MDWNYWDSNLIEVGLMKMKVLFAHGFEGAPDGGKPTYMREELGWDVVAPVMSANGWNIEQETRVLLEHLDSEKFDLVPWFARWVDWPQPMPADCDRRWDLDCCSSHRHSVWQKCGITPFCR